MAIPNDSNRQSRLLWFILAVLGAILCVVGWARWADAQQPDYLAAAADEVAGRFTTVTVICDGYCFE